MATLKKPIVPAQVAAIDGPGAKRQEAPIGDVERTMKEIEDEAKEEINIELDEADALFGKRSTVKDSHDRYAN